MLKRSIGFGLAGALLAVMFDFRTFTMALGFAIGLGISEFLRLNATVQQLRRRLDSLETQPQTAAAAQAPDTTEDHESLVARLILKTPPIPQASISPQAPEWTEEDAPANAQNPPRKLLKETLAELDIEATAAGAGAEKAQPGDVAAQGREWIAPTATRSEPVQQPSREAVADKARRRRTPEPIQAILDRLSMPTRIGIVVLFFGVSFLLKFAAEQGFFPVEVRLLCVVALGAAIYQIGRKLQSRQRTYGLLLRGAAIGIWYLSCYAAFSLYHLIGANLSFAILVALSGFTAWNAVRHDTKALAIFAIVGGFLAPILMSTGEGNHVVLFTYYAVVNAGIVAIAYRQTWRVLPMIGFIFTFVIGALWGATSYRPEYFATTEPFLLLSALFYLAVPLLFANQTQQGKLPQYSNLIVFGTPAVTFALQLGLVADFENGDAWSAALFGTTYALVLAAMWRKLGTEALLLRDAMVGIAVVFFTLAIAFALEQNLAGALWALEALGGVWLSARQKRVWGCYLSLLILFGSGVLWLLDVPSAGTRLLLNAAFFQIAIIALSGLAIAYILDQQHNWLPTIVPGLAAGWAAAWWLAGGIWQINFHLSDDETIVHAIGLYVLVSSAALFGVYHFLNWARAGHLSAFAMHLLAAIGLVAALQPAGPLAGLGALVWPLAVLYLYAATYALSAAAQFDRAARANYLLAAALLLALGIFEFYPFFKGHFTTIAGEVIGLTIPPLCVFWLLQRVRLWRPQFTALHNDIIASALIVLLGACFALGLIVAPGIEISSGSLAAWPLNLLQIAVLLTLALWWKQRGADGIGDIRRDHGWLILGIAAFLLANAMLVRFIHLRQGIPFDPVSLFANDVVQTSLSVFWTLVGVTAVMWASRNQHAGLWHLGMGLLTVVVAKLFLVDLAQRGTVERIVSFMAVGLLLMLVGWKSPRPQSAQREPAPEPPQAAVPD